LVYWRKLFFFIKNFKQIVSILVQLGINSLLEFDYTFLVSLVSF